MGFGPTRSTSFISSTPSPCTVVTCRALSAPASPPGAALVLSALSESLSEPRGGLECEDEAVSWALALKGEAWIGLGGARAQSLSWLSSAYPPPELPGSALVLSLPAAGIGKLPAEAEDDSSRDGRNLGAMLRLVYAGSAVIG